TGVQTCALPISQSVAVPPGVARSGISAHHLRCALRLGRAGGLPTAAPPASPAGPTPTGSAPPTPSRGLAPWGGPSRVDRPAGPRVLCARGTAGRLKGGGALRAG